MGEVAVKRVYEPHRDEDGLRVLVDRLWPRGIKRDDPRIGLWLKDVAPSAGLRAWFAHDPARWSEFVQRYRSELAGNPAADELLGIVAQQKRVTLVFGARDTEHNNAAVLQSWLQRRSTEVSGRNE